VKKIWPVKICAKRKMAAAAAEVKNAVEIVVFMPIFIALAI
jgi:hypothetical protein